MSLKEQRRICSKHQLEITTIDLKQSTPKDDKYLCTKCLIEKIDIQNMALMDETQFMIKEMKFKQQTFELKENQKRIENFKQMECLIKGFKVQVEEIFDKILTNICSRVRTIEKDLEEYDSKSKIDKFEDEVEILSKNYKGSFNYEIPMELDKLEADNQFYDSIEQMFQSFTSNPSYNQVIDHLQQNRNTDKQQEVKAFGIQNQKELDKSKTPCLNIKCNKHGKEIIMLNLEQNQVESSRLICVDCIHNNDPIKYTSLQNANLRWKYKNQDKIRADQNSRLLQQESIISNLKEIREQHNKILCELIEKLNNEQQSIQEVLQNQLDQTDIYEFNQEQIEEITLILCKKDKLTVSSDLQANIDQEDQIRYNLITNNLTNLFEYGLLKREEILKILGQDNSFAETLNDSIKSNEILRNGKVFIKEKYQVFKEDCQNLTLQINNLDQQLKEKNINITKVNELLQQKEQQLTQLQRDCKDVQYLQLQIQIQQLLQQQEQNQILNQYPFKLTFSQQFKHDACQISQDGKMVILHGMCGMYCCICDQIIPKHGLVKFAFRILNNSYLMIGICFRDMIQKNGYYDNYGKGAYFIDKDGKCFNHDQYDKNDKCISFKFTFNDIVIVEVDIQNKYIKWIKQSTNESYKLNIDTTQDLYPCVNLHYYSKAEIFSQFNE